MKKLLILTLLICAFLSGKAQNNYLLSGSVAGIEIKETGSGLLWNQNHTDTSEVTSVEKLWFVSPKGFETASSQWVQFGMLNVVLTNITSDWKKVTLYDFTGSGLIRTQNIAPNTSIFWDFPSNVGEEDKRLDASKNYYWKFENVASANVVCNNDAITMQASSFAYIDVLDNDLNIPFGADCRLKAGQTLTNLTVTKDQYTGLKVVAGSAQGVFSFVYEVVSSSGSVLGQATASITVGSPSQFCTLAILSEKLLSGSQTIHEFTLYSPNSQINPFNYEVRTGSITGTIVKSGTTPPATSNKEVIDFGTLATGTYYVKFSSSVSNCFDWITIEHVASSDACNLSILSIDKISGTNNYTVNTSFSGVTSIKYTLTDAQISIGTPIASVAGITTQSFVLSLTGSNSGTFFINIEGEGKTCKAQKSIEHTFVNITSGLNKLESYTKIVHNFKDNWIISGKQDNASGRDLFGMWSTAESQANVVWKTFISDFENEGNSPLAKAIIGLRKDTSRNEAGISVAVTPTSIILRQRSTRSGAYNTLATISGVTAPVWIRLTKTGNTLVADYSKDLSINPVYSEIATVNNVFNGWGRYQKYLAVASNKSDVLASARFQGHLGGTVNFTSPTVSVTPPVISSSVQNPTSGQSITLSTSTACVSPAVSRWYKNNDLTSFASGSTVNVQAFNTDTYYAKCENGLNKSLSSNAIVFNISNLPTCKNNATFDVLSAVYSNGSISFQFNASNLTNGTYSVLSGTNSVKAGSFTPSSSTVTVSTGSLSAGNYIFKIDGVSCTGSAQRTFNVSGVNVTAPVLVSVPVSPIQGDNITLTATGCSGNYNFFRNTETTPFASNLGSTTIGSASGGSYYYATCVGSTSPSNYIQVNQQGGVAPINQVSFSNPIKNVPIETVKGKYNPALFPLIETTYSTDPILNKPYPNWAVAWQAEGSNFSSVNRKTYDLGISFMYDQINGFYGGYGRRCTDYIYFSYPQTTDASCLKSNGQPYDFNEFVSAIPFEKRAWATYGETNVQTWQNYTLQQAYNEGISATGAIQYGWGDRVNGKVNTGLSNADIENGFELGQDGSNKHLAFLQGMGASSQGYVFSQYSAPLNVAYLDPANYPLNSASPTSAYPSIKLNPDGTTRGTNGTQANNVPYSNDWNFGNVLSLTGKSLADFKNVLPCAEMSSHSDATYHQGESFDASGSGEMRTVNKFYPNPNADHIIANTIHAGEVIKWFVKNKLDNRKVVLQSKITCDRDQMGITSQDPNNRTYNTYGFSIANQSLRFRHFDREYGFDIGGFTALTGCEWQIWDRNTEEYLDGYHGAFGIINVLNQKKTFGGVSKSFVDLKPSFNWLLWDSEISYDNGTSFRKDKAQDYLLNRTHIPQRQAITADGYWCGFLARPENTEATSCILRVLYNGQYYTYTVTANMWETVDYEHRNTPLASLPNSKKDYHFFLIKLGEVSNGEDLGAVVNPPTITSNPMAPVANSAVTFTASGCNGTVKWFIGDTQTSSGNTYTVSNPTNGVSYYATCTVGQTTSTQSNNISIGNNTVPVIVFVGESNAVPKNEQSTASAGDYGIRAGVRVWNNASNALENINIPLNTTSGQNASIASGWGWEVALSNLRASGVINQDINIVMTAQGGAFIGQYNTNIPNGYWSMLAQRVNATKSAILAEGKTPGFYVMYSQGINNAIFPSLDDQTNFPGITGITYWKTATLAMLTNLRTLMGSNTKIVMSKFFGSYGTYLNTAIDEIVATNPSLNFAVTTSDLGIQTDGLHYNASGTKTLAERMATTLNYFR